MSHTFLRLPAVKLRTGLSKNAIYSRMRKNEFPRVRRAREEGQREDTRP